MMGRLIQKEKMDKKMMTLKAQVAKAAMSRLRQLGLLHARIA